MDGTPITPRDGDLSARQYTARGGEDNEKEEDQYQFPDDGGDWQWVQDLIEEADPDEISLRVPKAVKEAQEKVQAALRPTWVKMEQGGQIYTPRTGHCLVAYDDMFYLMGGTSENGKNTSVYKFDPTTRKWEIMPVGGQPPCARSGAKTTMSDSNIVCFGGYSKRGGEYFNDLHQLDLKTAYWTKINVSEAPAPRVDHSMVSYRDAVYIFGGFKDKLRFKDLQKYSFTHRRWQEIPSSSSSPPGRVGHSAVVFDSCMYLFGGWSGRDTLDDLYQFNCDNTVYARIHGRGAAPAKRYRHSAMVYGRSMFIFGGTSKSQQRFADLTEFNFDYQQWNTITTLGTPPSARTFHCTGMFGAKMFIFGGFDGERLNDLHSIMLPGGSNEDEQKATTPRNGPTLMAAQSQAGVVEGVVDRQAEVPAIPSSIVDMALKQVIPEAARALQQQASRIMDVDERPKPLPPVRGIMSVPLMPLMESTVHLIATLTGLQACVGQALTFAREKETVHGPDAYGLTEDMVACIFLYTNEIVYNALNATLRSENREAVKSFFPFLRLLLAALQRLPSYSGTVYRGSRKDLSTNYVVGQEIPLWSFQSATIDAEALRNEAFLGDSGPRSLLCLSITGGKDISEYSAYAEEKEILIPAGCTFTVEEILTPSTAEGAGLKLFSMRQTGPSELLPSIEKEASKQGCCSVQ
jgi:N-acetylneuraminic acid mutarotase